MIRIFKLVLLLVVSQVAFGQAPSNYTNINGRYRWIAGMFDSTFHIPKGTSPSLRTGGSTNAGGLFYNTSDSSVYTYTGTQWIKARGSINPSDTTNKYVTQVYKKNGSDSVFYVKGGNHLFAFIDSVGSPGGGGGGKIYYFNGGVNMGTIGGLQMYELGDTANTGAAANFTRSTTGNIANFITDSGKPGLVQIPAGVWSVDAWLSETGGGANHAEIWIEVEKWDGSTITTIATSPIEQITEGSTPNLYNWSVSIPTTSLTVTDRIIIQFYISNTNGKTVTLYTQNGYVGEVHTTFTTGIGAINGLTAPAQYLVTGTSGTDFNINSVTATHTFNLPTASATNRGALSSTDWTTFNSKIGGSGTTNYVSKFTGSGTIGNSQIFDNATSVGIGTAFPSASYKLDVNGNINVSNAVNYSQGGTKYGWTYATAGAMAMEGLQGADISLGTGSGAVATERMVIKNSGNVGIGITPDSMFTVAQGTHLQRGVRMSGLPSAVGTKTLRIDASGTVSVADTLANGISGSGVNTQAAFFTGTNTIAGSSVLVLDGSNIAIGQAAAAQKLSVNGDVSIATINNATTDTDKFLVSDGGVIKYRTGSEVLSDIGAAASTSISGTTNYIPKFTSSSAIGNSNLQTDASGNLGLGVTPSPWSVYKSFDIETASLSAAGVQVEMVSNAYFNGSNWIYKSSTFPTRYVQNSGAAGGHSWFTAPSGTAGNAISFTQAMTLDADGDLGIGTTNPQRALHVKSGAGTAQIESTGTTSMLYFGDANSTGLDNRGIGSAGNDLWFMAGATEKMRLDASGNLGLGVSPSNWASGEAAMQTTYGTFIGNSGLNVGRNIYYNAGWKYIGTGHASLYNQSSGIHTWSTAVSGTAGNAVAFSDNMTLDASGNLGLGVTPSAWSTGSSARALQLNAGSLFSFSTTQLHLEQNSYFNSGFFYVNNGTASAYRQVDGVHVWLNAPSGTAGNAISFTQAMTLDASGRLGIGTTSLFGLLNLQSGTNARWEFSSGASATLELLNNARNAYVDFNVYANNYIFNRLGAESMRITSGGNVGIGTTNPNAPLSLSGSADVGIRIKAGASALSYIDFDEADSGTPNGSIAYNHGTNAMTFATGGSNDEKMRITSGGDVGIGTSSPLQTTANRRILTVNGTNQAIVNLGINGSLGGYFYADATSAELYSAAQLNLLAAGANPMLMYTNGSERMRITSGGNVLIGTTSNSGVDKVRVNNDGTTSYSTVNITNANSTATMYVGVGGSAVANTPLQNNAYVWNGGASALVLGTSNTEQMRITSGGEVYIAGTTDQGAYNLQVNGTGVWGAGAYVDGSDSAVKKNIQPLGSSLDLIKQMNPVTFEYQPFYSKDTTTQTGFIAQELQQVLSDKVYKNGIVKEGGQYLGVAYQHLIPLLVKAIQELEAQVQALKSQLNNR